MNFGFFLGEFDNPEHHHIYELFGVIVANLIATVLKFGERTQMGAVLHATSLMAVLQLVAAALVWTIAVHVTNAGLNPSVMGSIVSLSGGAMLANVIYVPGLCADASLPGNLLAAGLAHPLCAGVIALSDSDQIKQNDSLH